MTLLTGKAVTFGAVVRYRDNGKHYLVVGWRSRERHIAVCDRPDEDEQLIHVHWLTVVKHPRKFVPHGRRHTRS